MTNPAIDRIIRAHEAAESAKAYYEGWKGKSRYFPETPSDEDNHAAWQAAESAFSTAVTDAFKVGEDEVAEVMRLFEAAVSAARYGGHTSLKEHRIAFRAAIAAMSTPSGEKDRE